MDSEFVEDVRGVPRRAVSVSSCSSDPLEFRHRTGAGSSRSSVCGSDSDDGDDAFETRSNASSMGGDSVLSGISSGSRGGDPIGKRRYHAVDALDVGDVAKDVDGQEKQAIVGALVEGTPTPSDPSVQNTTEAPVALAVPLDLVSEAAVATVESIITSSSTVVAAKRPDALVLDAGTRMCLGDGTVVGIVATVLGPVAHCAYAIVCKPATLAALALEDRVAEDVALHYDLSKQFVLYDPSVQCDTARGSDASFLQDEELPPNARPDFSDDEEERHWKKRKRTAVATVVAAPPLPCPSGSAVAAAVVAKPLLTGAAAPMATVEDDLSSDESEVEFDEEGNMVAYKPRQRRRAPVARGGGNMTRTSGDRPRYY